jgi:hypothetical protein
MNLYYFVYCYFYQIRNSGRILASAHVLFTLLIHYLLLSEIVLRTTGIKIFSLPNFGQYGTNKSMYFIFAIPFWILLGLFFNRTRTKQLLARYNKIYTKQLRNTMKIIWIIILPTILVVLLAVLRQKSII